MSEPRRSIKRIGIKGYKIYEVDSIPSDEARYIFLICNIGNGRFYFMGFNGLNYPNELIIVKGNDYTWDLCLALAAIKRCTPHTIKECIAVAEIISTYEEGE